jgi:hypothetical protein
VVSTSIAVILIMTLFGLDQIGNFLDSALLNGTMNVLDNGSCKDAISSVRFDIDASTNLYLYLHGRAS